MAVYSENKLQHYAVANRNHKSAGEQLGLFRFCKFFTYFFFQQIHYSLFRNQFLTEQHNDLSEAGKQWLISHIWHWKSLNLCCLSKQFDIFNVYETI